MPEQVSSLGPGLEHLVLGIRVARVEFFLSRERETGQKSSIIIALNETRQKVRARGFHEARDAAKSGNESH